VWPFSTNASVSFFSLIVEGRLRTKTVFSAAEVGYLKWKAQEIKEK